jgi:hypothetical protein
LLAGCDLLQFGADVKFGTDIQGLLLCGGTSSVEDKSFFATSFAHRSAMFVPHVLVVLVVALPALATTFAQTLQASMLASPGNVGFAEAAGGCQTGEGEAGGGQSGEGGQGCLLANHFAGA